MAARRGNGVVEAAVVRLGRLGGFAGSFEDGQVGGVDVGEVGCVDLGEGVSESAVGGQREMHTGNLALTSARALPATPSETWNSE